MLRDKSINALLAFIVVLASGIIASCTKSAKSSSPQEVLSEYVSRSFSVKGAGDKEKLAELTSGDVRKMFDEMAIEDFKRSFIEKRREFLSLKIRDERRLHDGRYSLTYEISYLDGSTPAKDRVTSKKHAIFSNIDGKWRVSDVQNLKTLVDQQSEIEIQADKMKANF